MPGLQEAIALAVNAHRGQVDKAGEPYILHPLRVMLSLEAHDDRIVGVLHDVVEDSRDRPLADQVTLARLRELGYSERVVEAIAAVTRQPGESYADFIERLRPNSIARRVKLADLADNLDVCRLAAVGEHDIERLNRYLAARARLRAN